jgi:hypothetical protein
MLKGYGQFNHLPMRELAREALRPGGTVRQSVNDQDPREA